MKVSVLMLTYNQEEYVAQALQSVLMQQTDFEYEIVIGEDCSTDQTREIVKQYREQYPSKIRLLLPEQNVGMHRNFVDTLRACRGEYIAILEGDDYWTSPDKLKKQVDFLEAHPLHAICFHDVKAFYQDDRVPDWNLCPPDQKETSTLKDLLSSNFIPTCSVMFRHGLIRHFPEWFYTLMFVDWPLHIFNARHGHIGYINEVMASYRIHDGGVFSMKGGIRQHVDTIKMLEHVDEHLEYQYSTQIRRRIFKTQYTLAVAFNASGDRAAAGKYIKKCLLHRPMIGNIPERLKLFLRFYCPVLFNLSKNAFRHTRDRIPKM